MDHVEKKQVSRYKCFKDKKKSARLHTKKNKMGIRNICNRAAANNSI